MAVHHPDRQISRKDTVGWPEAAGIWSTLEQLKRYDPLPRVPIVVVTGARPSDDPVRIELLPVWTKSHADWIKTLPQGRHVIEPSSGHGVHVEAPELVVQMIRDVVDSARGRKSADRTPQPMRHGSQ
jgi:pimeloyl-ACP methyl ester carboxylesterase